MLRAHLLRTGMLGVVSAAFLVFPTVSLAQHGGGHGGGGHGGGGHGGGGHGGGGAWHGGGGAWHGGGSHGGPGAMHGDFHHGDFNHDGFHHSHFFFGGYPYYDYGFGYYPYSTGFWGGYGYPGYYSYPYYSSDYYTYPYASDSVMPDTYGYYPAYSAADAAGYAPAGVAGGWDQSDQRVMARIVLPTPDAQLWVEGQEMTSTGTVRSFVSPSLEPGKYTYTFRVRWTGGGRMMEQTRKVGVHPGDRITVDFSTEEQISMPKSKP